MTSETSSLAWCVRELRRYVALQSGLLAALASSDEAASRSGTVEVDGDTWRFVRHGGGVRFEDLATRACVDVPERCDEPTVFDAWRIEAFVGSLGPSAARHVARAAGVEGAPLDASVPAALERLVGEGDLVRDGDGFAFPGPRSDAK